MTDKRVVTDAEVDEISEVSVRALLDTRERCIEVLEALLRAPFTTDVMTMPRRALTGEEIEARDLLRELHGEGEGE